MFTVGTISRGNAPLGKNRSLGCVSVEKRQTSLNALPFFDALLYSVLTASGIVDLNTHSALDLHKSAVCSNYGDAPHSLRDSAGG